MEPEPELVLAQVLESVLELVLVLEPEPEPESVLALEPESVLESGVVLASEPVLVLEPEPELVLAQVPEPVPDKADKVLAPGKLGKLAERGMADTVPVQDT
ncbi:hypothetical protein [Anoxybacterium hadale]|uniref:hypothetical protein n=1 Tax=Anoxybacterium hadale TaxID=3408580 RepID=UPI003AFFD4E3